MNTRKKGYTLLQSSSLPTSQAGTVILFLILAILTGTCEAQTSFNSSIFTIIFILVILVAVICIVSCGCICCIAYACNHRQQPSLSARTIQYTYNNHQSQIRRGAYPQSQYSSGSQPYPEQIYRSGHPAYPTPAPQPTATVEPQPVSLPEATLHQGDAPPAYEEAVRMKTVDLENDENR